MSTELSSILSDWPFDPEKAVRVVRGRDGRERMQLRVDQGAFQGVLQMDLDGRPDGTRPHGREFALDHYEECATGATHERGRQFRLDHEACEELFDESRRIYERYIFLLQWADYARVVRDTERNMRAFRFIHRHALEAEDRDNLERWWPYILRIHAQAKTMIAVREKAFDEALSVVAETRQRIEGLTEVDAEEFRIERERSLRALDGLERTVRRHRPLSPEEKIEKDLRTAIAEERFERAAFLRDRLRDLRTMDSSSA